MKKDLLPKKDIIAVGSYKLDDPCAGCQHLTIVLEGQILHETFSVVNAEHLLEFSENLRSFLEQFEEDFRKQLVAGLGKEIDFTENWLHRNKDRKEEHYYKEMLKRARKLKAKQKKLYNGAD